MVQPYLPARWLITSVDTADDPDVFPFMAGQGFYALKTPMWSTLKATSASGRSRRQKLWSYPIWQWKIPYEVIFDTTNTEIQKFWAFYNSHGGGYGEFFLRDRTDCTATLQAFGVGDGVTTTFQLQRTMNTGAITFQEPVYGVSGVPTILVGGTAVTAFTVGEYAQITFATAPAAGQVLTWSGTFLFLVTFNDDQLDTAQVTQGAWSSGGITLTTAKR